ncbi:hypothetical protein MRX96_026004 [Rhipicephalus microplus]
MPRADTLQSAKDDVEAQETGAATHPVSSAPTFVLVSDTRMFIQENVYAILGHGNFQRRLLFTGMLSVTVLLLHAFANFLIGRDVDHWCRQPDDLSHVSRETWRNTAIPIEADGSHSRCTVYHPALPTPDDAVEIRSVIPCYRWDYDTQDVSDSIVSRWDLVCNKRWLYKFTMIANMLGAALLVPATGFVSDQIGRQLAILGSVICLLVCSVACSVAQTFVMFLVTRFFVSAASCSVQVLMFILIYEVTGNQNRATYGVLDTALGTTLVPPALYVLSIQEPHWVMAHLVLLLPTFMLVFWCFLLDESPAWLLSTGNPRAAEAAAVAAATSNGLSAHKAREDFRALVAHIQRRDASNQFVMTVGGSDMFMHEPLFRWGVMSVLLSWFSVNLAYYGLVLQNADTGHVWRTIHMVVQALLYASVCWYISDHGQRETLSILLAFLCASAVIHAAVSVTMAGPLSSAVALVVESLASAALSVNYGYTAEVFPTTVRSIGLTISYAFGRVGVIVASFIVVLWGGANEADIAARCGGGCVGFVERRFYPVAARDICQEKGETTKQPLNTRRRSSGSASASSSKTSTLTARPPSSL